MRLVVLHSARRSSISRRRPHAGINPALVICSLLLLPVCATTHAQVLSDVSIQTSDGIHLEATITKPSGNPPPGGFPGIVLVHGFGGNKDDMRLYSVLVTAYGYASIAYSVRGQGNSEGLSTIGGDRERQDLLEVIQYFRNTAGINPDKLGVTGGSQGGIHSWMAAIYRMPGILAVAPLFATADYATALTPRGCVKYGLVRELTLASVRYSDDRERMHGFIIADQYDSVLQYIHSRDLARLIDSIQVPVLQGLGWGDYLFPINGGIAAHERLTSREIPSWSYYGTNGHDEQINTSEAGYLLQILIRWFDHWLLGAALDQDSLSLVMYSDDRPDWPHHTSTTWPPAQSSTLRMYFTHTGLSQSPPSSPGTFPFSLSYNAGYTSAKGWDDRYGGPDFVNAFTSTSARFMSEPLGSDIEITGIPGGKVFLKSDQSTFQAHVRVYDVMDVDTGHVWDLMSRSVNGIRGNVPGEQHALVLEATALSHIVPAGHRIGVEVTSLDMLREDQANIIPYFVTSHSELLSTGSSPSYVDLPVVQGTPADIADIGGAIPDGFALAQNYPNPFNPTTTIRFRLRKPGLVTLRVYDMLGRETSTLVNQDLPPGEYERRFDARDLGSGVYFYRLQAGTFVETKKMILLK